MNSKEAFANWNVTQGKWKQLCVTLTDRNFLLKNSRYNEMLRKPESELTSSIKNCTVSSQIYKFY
jgi:hypothetical protein